MGAAMILFLLVVVVLVTLAGRPFVLARLRTIDPVVEDHAVMCFQNAQAADVTFIGDRKRGRWVDVGWCSHQKDGVRCDRSCVAVMNSARVRPA